MSWLRALAAGAALCCATAGAEPSAGVPVVAVTVEILGETPGEGVAVFVAAEPATSTPPLPERVTASVLAPGRAELRLASGVLWRLSAVADGFWAAPVVASAPDMPVRIVLRPTGVVEGSFAPPRGTSPPGEATLRFASPPRPPGTGDPSVPESTIGCPVAEGRFRCAVPVGMLDLRLGARGFVPHYLWGAEVPAGGALRLGRLSLVPGASVSGRVTTVDGAPDASGAAAGREATLVELSPLVGGAVAAPSVEERLARQKIAVPIDSRGFFQLEGVAPGSYALVVTRPGYAPARVAPVDVVASGETVLPETVVLHRPARLELAFAPPLDPYGRPWRVRLFEVVEADRSPSAAAEGEAGRDGRFVAAGLAPGSYRLVAGPEADARWVYQDLMVEPGAQTVPFEVPVVALEGRLTRGGEPVAARLWFGGTHGPRKIGLDADEDGRFEGWLPSEGPWAIELEDPASGAVQALDPVEVRLRPGKSRAALDVEIPDTWLAGEVVDEAGEPAASATVTLINFDDRRREAVLQARADGRFSVAGIPPGQLFVQATAAEAVSEMVGVTVEEGSAPSPLRLVVRQRRELSGAIRSAVGPVPGALVEVRPDLGGAPVAVEQVVTGADGTWSAPVPRGAAAADLFVFPPGFAARMVRVPLVEEVRPLDLLVERQAGTLELVLPEPGAGVAVPVLLHAGAMTHPASLGGWARRHGAPPVEPGRLVLPLLEPGEYALCLYEGRGAPLRGCAIGTLAPWSELTLHLAAPAATAETGGRP